MGILFMLVFIIGMTIITFWGDGRESDAERAVRIGAVPAGQMVALHAAVVRACSANMASCPPNTYINKYVSGPFLSPPYDMTTRAFQDGDYRFGSYFDGTSIYTYFTGVQNASTTPLPRDILLRQSVLTWLYENMPKHTFGSIGVYDKANARFVARDYYSTASYNGTSTTGTSANPISQITLDGAIPQGAPLMRTRLKAPAPAGAIPPM